MRTSSNEIINNKIFNGYDYENQAWVIKGKYQDCNHPESMNCNCYGRINKGKEIIT